MKLAFLLLPLMFIGLNCGSSGGSSANGESTQTLKIATLNMYVGFSVESLLDGSVDLSDDDAVTAALALVYQQYLDNEPDTRIAAMASDIISEDLDIIGLQEAINLTLGSTTINEFVTELISEISSQGGPTYQSLTLTTFSVTLPFGSTTVTFVDQEAILYKSSLDCSAPNSGKIFDAARDSVTILGESVTLTRGVLSSMCSFDNNEVYLFSTHLEVGGEKTVQEQQGEELLDFISDTVTDMTQPIVLTGDINSEADGATNTYDQILNDNFMDGYRDINTDASAMPGDTCCQQEDLSNTTSENTSRFDYVFYKGNNLTATNADLFVDALITTSNGTDMIWPSDHFGVYVTFDFN